MDLSINQRVKEVVQFKGLTEKKFLIDIGMRDTGQASRWFTDSEGFPPKHLLSMIKAYKDINARWLITGEGKMIEGEKYTIPAETINEIKDLEPKYEYNECVEKEKIIDAQKETIQSLKETIRTQRELIEKMKGDNGEKKDFLFG